MTSIFALRGKPTCPFVTLVLVQTQLNKAVFLKGYRVKGFDT